MPTPMGPNVRKLVAERAAQLAAEKAKERHGVADFGALAQGIVDGTLQVCLREAATWVTTVVALARNSPGGEKWPTDEDMAGEILRQIAERKAGKK